MSRVIDEALLYMLEGRDLTVHSMMTGLFGGTRRARGEGSSAEFADCRDYAPGDDLRRVDTKLYARFNKLYIRLRMDERQLHHRILLDTSASMEWGAPNKSHTAIRLAAAFGYLSAQAMDRVTFHSLNGQDCTLTAGPVVGRDAFLREADKLESVRFSGDADLSAALTSCPATVGVGGVDLILSDFMTDSDWKTPVDRLLASGREVNLIRILSRDEITPRLRGRLRLVGRESRDEYRDEVDRAGLDAYREAYNYVTRDIRTFCAARGVGFCTVCTDEDILEKIASAGMTV